MNATPFVLGADDYGIAPGVGAAIRALLARGRLSGTSCLVLSPHFGAEAPKLRGLAHRGDVGLHLALTQLAPLGPMPRLAPAGRLPSPGLLVALALSRRLDPAEIGAEIDRQLDAFERAFGRAPDYVDGHHHVQQLPVVREALIARFRARLPRGTALRVCAEPLGAVLRRGVAMPRAAAIALLGRGLRRLADAAGIASNRRFAGVRDFTENRPYRALFRRFLQGPAAGLAVMCHPGHPDAALAALDPVTGARQGEFDYLAGDEFPQDLAAAGLRLGRFRELA
jgi:predicted glycoside hydrolase/deacetylase ChbG (UPF0249 family)